MVRPAARAAFSILSRASWVRTTKTEEASTVAARSEVAEATGDTVSVIAELNRSAIIQPKTPTTTDARQTHESEGVEETSAVPCTGDHNVTIEIRTRIPGASQGFNR